MMEPITREEVFMKAAGERKAVNLPTPITREERYLAKSAGLNVTIPEPITRKEMYLNAIANSGGGSGGDVGWVVCEETAPTNGTTIDKLQGLRLSLPNATSVEEYAFWTCDALTSVDLPVATSIEDGAFRSCNLLTSVNLPVATSIGKFAFQTCNSLPSVNLPAATSIGEEAFAWCDALTSVNLPVATSIGKFAFLNCTNLSALILRNTETVCQIIVTAVVGTKIVTAEGAPTGEGFVYVPSALYEGYVELIAMQAEQMVGDAATAEYIARAVLRKIEDYPEICG